jgi:hypothetical protein
MKAATIINTSGQALPFSFGMAALARFCTAHGLKLSDVSDVLSDPSPDVVLSLLWHGFADGYRRERKDFNITTDDIGDLLDSDNELAQKCMQVISESMPKGEAEAGNGQQPRRIKARG